MRTMRINKTPLYLCKRKETEDGAEYFEAPIKIEVNNNIMPLNFIRNEYGVSSTGSHDIVYSNRETFTIDTGDRLYYKEPKDFDYSAHDADLYVKAVTKGLNNYRATVHERCLVKSH